jgi:hypothetical protein
MLWALEERIHSLGWAAEWSNKEEFSRAVSRDVEGLAAFPRFRQLDRPDLAAGHSGRLLWTAATKWNWVSEPLRKKLLDACSRHVEEILPYSQEYYRQIRTKADIIALASPYPKLHNIPLIGTIGASLTGSTVGHRSVGILNGFIGAVMGAILDFLGKGYTEGVAYDGYILDFIGDWLESLPAEQRKPILEHPNLRLLLDNSYMLSAPGAMEQVAELGDVEAREMPFHYSGQAKLARFQPDPIRAWYLRRWRAPWIRADAMGALHHIVDTFQGTAAQTGVHKTSSAVVLRTGWGNQDLAVVASCTNSPTGHLQLDNGTVVIGTNMQWIVSDPGYQQYMAGPEREFTIGPAAHNCPVINGYMQDKKEPRLISLQKVESDLFRTKLDLTACYPAKANITSVIRSIWLSGRTRVVIADQVTGDRIDSVKYHWHGHPDAGWWARDGWILLRLSEVALWFTSPQAELSGENIRRLPSSRGQLTLISEVDPAAPVSWWAFAFTDAPPLLKPIADGTAIDVAGTQFRL